VTDEPGEGLIDIHVHVRKTRGFPRGGKQAYVTPEQLVQRFDDEGVERGVILPRSSPECSYSLQTFEEVLEICAGWPGRFIPFCNVDPRELTNSPDAPLGELLAYYKDNGAKGVGEVCANLPFNHPLVENLFRHVQDAGLPLTFHVGHRLGGCYGLFDLPGLPLLEGALARFPRLRFLGHSQPFWAEIGPVGPAERNGYPGGPVAEEGRVVRLMRRYDNLYGDLSANSGFNAVTRDEEFGPRFLDEFHDRLCFGTDIVAPDTPARLPGVLRQWRDEGRISAECFRKIARGNAEKLLGLSK
jgi:hypothetical protein